MEEIGTAEGFEKATKTILDFLNDTTGDLLICADQYWPSVALGIDVFRNSMLDLAKKKVHCRFITEITAENLHFCKDLMAMAEVRHLAGLKGNFAANQAEYIASATMKNMELLPQVLYSNAQAVVEQHHFFFETLWSRAMPAEQKIREIEDGLLPVETRVIDNHKEIFNHVIGIAEKTKTGLSNCSSFGGFQLIHDNDHFFRSYINLLERYRDEKASDGIRWVTHIDDNTDQINLIRKFLRVGVQIKHVNNLPPLHFILSESQFLATIERMEGGTMFQRVLYSTEPPYIRHFQLLFEELWKTGIDAEQRISQIERGTASETTVVVENSMQTKKLFLKMIQEAKEEIMIVFPSFNAVRRQHMIGVIGALRQKSKEGVKIRVLSPINDGVSKIFQEEIESLTSKNTVIREITKQQDIKSTILMADKKHLLAIELKDDSSETFDEAIGLATYSTSKPTILSNISIFESLWTQTELYERLRVANQKLETQTQMQNDFINIAAHELRTPTQAISGNLELIEMAYVPSLLDYSSNRPNSIDLEFENLVKDKDKMHEFMESLASTYRNSQRLEKLVKDILDVSRIESNRLEFHKEYFNLNEKIRNVIKDIHAKTKSNFQEKGHDSQQPDIAFETFNDPIVVFADKIRIFEAISNLLSNAIKFSNGQSIHISANIVQENSKYKEWEKVKHNNEGLVNRNKAIAGDMVIVSIKDSGKGIDKEILSRLFTKFATKSDKGTGLGLYIAKSIVEAHGGQIWAQNNDDGKGATFSFSLPIDKKTQL
ncbi:MAG: ATP-binding protein [Thermoproteota archaeon]|nr:ATP-binding protein [Thermoproteota archaeon]